MGENIFGRDATLKFFMDPAPIIVKSETIRVEEIGDMVADQINGADRAEFQTIIDGYLVTINNFFDRKDLIEAWLRNRATEDAQANQLTKLVGIKFQFHDGAKANYIAKACTLDPFKINIGGRKERVKGEWSLHAQYFTSAQAT